MGDAGTWIRLLLAFDVVFLGSAIMAFEHVIEV
jgi:hypothetical protein